MVIVVYLQVLYIVHLEWETTSKLKIILFESTPLKLGPLHYCKSTDTLWFPLFKPGFRWLMYKQLRTRGRMYKGGIGIRQYTTFMCMGSLRSKFLRKWGWIWVFLNTDDWLMNRKSSGLWAFTIIQTQGEISPDINFANQI